MNLIRFLVALSVVSLAKLKRETNVYYDANSLCIFCWFKSILGKNKRQRHNGVYTITSAMSRFVCRLDISIALISLCIQWTWCHYNMYVSFAFSLTSQRIWCDRSGQKKRDKNVVGRKKNEKIAQTNCGHFMFP